MEEIYLIQNVQTKEYYYYYRTDEGFTEDSIDASSFKSRQSAESQVEAMLNSNVKKFKDFHYEIKKYYKYK